MEAKTKKYYFNCPQCNSNAQFRKVSEESVGHAAARPGRGDVAGENRVEKGYPKYVAHAESANKGKVYINKDQFFEGVNPEVWEFHIGGYQVCEKWLKDRRERKLSYEEISHYQKIVVALGETIRLMQEPCLCEMFEGKSSGREDG